MKVEVNLSPAEEVAKALSQGIIDFNRQAVPDLQPNDAEVRFHVIATDDFDQIIGGLRASCYWNTLHIELLWLASSARGSGVGRQIIRSAEEFARDQGCEKALVETTSRQAKPSFYERNGYSHMATLSDRPKDHATHYLSKNLTGG